MRSLFSLLLAMALCASVSSQRLVPVVKDHSLKSKFVRVFPSSSLAAGINIIYQEDFEASGTAFPYRGINSVSNASDGGYKIGDVSASNTGQVFKVPAHGRFAFTNDDECNCDKSDDQLVFPVQSLTGASNMYLFFDVYFNRVAQGEKAWIEYDTGNGYQMLAPIKPNTQWQSYQLALLGTDNRSATFRFRYDDGGGVSSWASGLAIDNVIVCEAEHDFDLAVDSVLIEGRTYQEYYKEIPRGQGASADIGLTLSTRNSGKKVADNSTGVTVVGVVGQQKATGSSVSLAPGRSFSSSTIQHYGPARGSGIYRFLNYPESDSVDQNKSNDTLKFDVKVTDTTLSRVHSDIPTRSFWYGPGVDFTLTYEFDLKSLDTATSISVFIDPETPDSARIDLNIFSEFFPSGGDFVKDTFPQINENILLRKAEHIGKWVTFRIPHSPLAPGKYFLGVTTRSGNVKVGVAADPVSPGLVKARIPSGAGNSDYMPYLKLNFVYPKCDTLKLNTTTTRPNCGFQNGGFSVSVSGGSSPYKYQWGENAAYATSNAITGIGSGVYQLTVTDTAGCSTVQTFGLSDQGSVNINLINLEHEKCLDDLVGKIQVSASGGTPPYKYQWSNGSSDTLIDMLNANQYSLTVTDASASGCRSVSNYLVEGPKEKLKLMLKTTSNACFNDSVGRIEAIPTGGFGAYNYQWTPSVSNTRIADNLKNGTYSLTVSDINNCDIADTTTIVGSPQILMSGFVLDTSGLGSIYVNVSGGIPPFKYSWQGPSGSDFRNPGTKDLTELRFQGSYTLTVRDSLGCELSDSYQVGGVVSTNPVGQRVEWKVYPNPIHRGGVLRVQGIYNKSFIVEIFDMQGRLTKTVESQTDISMNQAGLFLVKVSTQEGNTESFKILVR